MSTGNTTRNSNVKSIHKAFRIIEVLDESGPLSIGDISAKLSMDKGTVHRLVNTIKEAGYINQDKDTKRYENSIKLFAIGQRVLSRTGLRDIARPYLEKLAEESNETINLSAFTGNGITYIDKIDSPLSVKIGINVGASLPLHCSGMGKAILAFMDKGELEETLGKITYTKMTEFTAGSREELELRLAKIKEQGYSTDKEEFSLGLISFAAPIFAYEGKPIAALSLSCPKVRFDGAVHEKIYSKAVRETAEIISGKLGYKL